MSRRASPRHAPLLARASRRHLLRHPWQLALAVLGVALGVAVFVSIDLANQSAKKALSLSLGALQGKATHEIVASAPEGIPEELFVRLVRAGVRPAAPVIEATAIVTPKARGAKPEALPLLGIDPFSEAPFRPAVGRIAGGGLDLKTFLTVPGACLLARGTAGRLGVAVGKRFAARFGTFERSLLLSGLLEPAPGEGSSSLSDLLICDIATAQEATGRLGHLTRIDLVLPEGAAGARELTRVRTLLPAGVQIQEAAGRLREGDEMTRAFRMNLKALSLLALVCGTFLIYNTMTFLVVERRRLLGLLRALGATRREIFRGVLGEAAAIGAVGTLLGLVAGVVLGRGLVRLVAGTINDLYFALSVRDLALPPWTFVTGIAVGLGVTLLAALAPAIEATGTPPQGAMVRSLLEAKSGRALRRATGAGALGLALGALVLPVPGLFASFVVMFCAIIGFALLAPGAAVLLGRALRAALGRRAGRVGWIGRMAATGLERNLSRTGVAVAALVVAVSVTVGVGAMIASFRGSVERWLDRSLTADLYVGPAEREAGFVGASRPGDLIARLGAIPGVVRVRPLRRAEAASPRKGAGTVRLIAVEGDPAATVIRQGNVRDAWAGFARGEILASEPLAARLGLRVGSSLPLATAEGVKPFRVAGIYLDYASDRGIAMIDGAHYRRLWRDDRVSGLGLDLAQGASDAELERVAAIVRTLDPEAPLGVRSNKELRRRSLVVFDRTFKITGVLRFLAGLVAFLGVLSALLALQLERTREIGVLRALGMTTREVGALVAAETGLLGLSAGLLSIPVGFVLALILIEVINRRSFGWSMDLVLTPGVFLGAVALSLTAALLAGVVPAIKMARTSPAEALREE
ncbi:MAG TPA: FtsX-like permease family protein [Thermoanaerobaculia bacterium]|nr:FtsX-like permease family protein [Thermoanaerobaculia bacterium]